MENIKNVILSLFLTAAIYTYGQKETPKCFADQLLERAFKENAGVKERINAFDRQIVEHINKPEFRKKSNVTLTIPVVVYVVYSTGMTNISNNQIFSQIDALNSAFLETGLKFCLATKFNNNSIPIIQGSTQTTPGIIRMSNSLLSNHNASTDQTALINGTGGAMIPSNKYLRIWIVSNIVGTGNAGMTLGYSMFPNTSTVFDGVVIRSDVFGDVNSCPTCNLSPLFNQGKTLVHEIGHYFGLYHTFHEGCKGINGSNCETEGDRVCDTPPTKDPNFDCLLQNSCNESPNMVDDIHNFMDYGDDTCISHFTDGQNNRIIATITSARSELVSIDNLIETGVCNSQSLLSSSFQASNYMPCPGSTVNFSPVLTSTNYLWDFGDPSSLQNSSTLQNPMHTFAASNLPYTVTLTVSNGVLTSTSTNKIYVSNCAPISSTDGNWYFSDRNGLNFSSGVPIGDSGALIANNFFGEASAVQSNSAGQLLFYTDALKIFNSSHQSINPTSLLGSPSSHGGALIVPKPGDNTKYYVFIAMDGWGNKGFTYSIVNVTGTTVNMSNNINIPITIPIPGYELGNNQAAIVSEGISALEICDGYWIVSCNRKNSRLYLNIFKLTSTGLIHTSEFPLPSEVNTHMARIKFSPNGNKLIYVGTSINAMTGGAYVFDFNKNNGVINNRISLEVTNGYGVSFSPDSNLLYISKYTSQGFGLQFNISSNNPLITKSFIPDFTHDGDLQLGPDNKLYAIKNNANKLGVIHEPNNIITQDNPNACQYTKNGPLLPDGSWVGLPNIIDGKISKSIDNSISSYAISCFEYKFVANVCSSNFNWNFGDSQSSSNISSESSPTHTFSGLGSYIVTMTYGNTVITKNIIITNPEIIILGNPKVCPLISNKSNYSVSLLPNQDIQWSITNGTGTILGLGNQSDVTIAWSNLPATVTATITTDYGCSISTSFNVVNDCAQNTQCPTDLTLTGNENILSQIYSASNSITTENNYQVIGNHDISLLASNYIFLKPNSWIKNGAIFLAKIENCVPSNTDRIITKGKDIFKKLNLYPNPTDGILHLSGISMNEISLFDISGKNVFFGKYNSTENTSIDIGNLQQGIYLLKVTDKDNIIETYKIVKN